ncbi:hypothetical protein QRD89_13115 [Halobacillus sp. ACCC02827]|uniref:hypothetical protein n=1 Tax=Bacillaceae TaxID=186817 RepID=UPI0002A501B1|nr:MULTISPECIES: hypothetical protein [Bacillaceae]ELK47315.1 hypothetical protein D479_07697 [Halobacillus sp. BAB-2008]QHT47428.1 hypothetical protein M662_13335 [Bacillus sp. SB49]WJE14652.1 hypothetical protein QRD89_13115 [Halobacillus sp. ACCC02827]
MKEKWLAAGLGAGMCLVWFGVLAVYLWMPESADDRTASNHSMHAPQMKDKAVSSQELARRYVSSGEEAVEHNTVLGKQMLTKEWTEDMQKDGKVSIDTVLNSLELQVSVADNS